MTIFNTIKNENGFKNHK